MPGQHALRRVCLHEYAHLAVARAHGATGFVRIARVVGCGADAEHYAGAFQMHGELDDRAWRLVALAGTIAEWIGEQPSMDTETVVARLAAPITPLPAGDAPLAAGFDADDVRTCVALLRSAWAALEAEADERARGIAASRGA